MNFGTILSAANFAMNAQRMAQPQGLAGIAPLDRYAYAGTLVEWNGEVWLSNGAQVRKPHWDIASSLEANIETGLRNSGQFSSVTVRASGLSTLYFTINVMLASDFARLGDVLSIIESNLWNTWDPSVAGGFLHLAFKTYDFTVISTPAIAIATPGSAIPSPTPTGQLPSGVTSRNRQQYEDQQCPYPKSIFCDCGEEWSMLKLACVPIDAADDGKNFFDGLADWLGVTPTQAVIVGALGAVLAVVAIKRVL